MPELADLNLAPPMTSPAWAALDLASAEHEAAGDVVVGYGSMRLTSPAPMAPGLLSLFYLANGEYGAFGYPVGAGVPVSFGVLLNVLDVAQTASAYVQLNFYNSSGTFQSFVTGNAVDELGALERSAIQGAIAPATGYVLPLLVLAAGAGAGARLDVYAGQQQLHVGAGRLPRYTADLLPAGYDVRLGPLAFTWPSGPAEETLGDSLEAVGAALTPSTRRPRPLKVPVRVEGAVDELDVAGAGRRLRRQVAQLLDNPRWTAQGLYLWWRADPALGGWVRLSGGTLTESDPGVTFGIWDLELETPYLAGRPSTHRAGRRLDLADRRSGLVPRDTRGTIYSTDGADLALPAEPLVLPGDTRAHVATVPRPGGVDSGLVDGPVINGRRLWRRCVAADGEVVTYSPDEDALPNPGSAHVTLDDPGAVRVWDLTAGAATETAELSLSGDLHPDLVYGWERVCGARIAAPTSPLALDNGLVRLIWRGLDGLAFEWSDPALAYRYRRQGHVRNALDDVEAAIVELTPERAVVEWRAGHLALRAILQRGWYHARLEAYDDSGAAARLEWADLGDGTPLLGEVAGNPWIRYLTHGDGYVVGWAQGTLADAWVAPTLGGDVAVTRDGAVVAQVGSPLLDPVEVARWSLCDARSVPVLAGRA